MKHRNIFAGVAATAFLLSASAALAADPSFGGDTIRAKPSAKMSNMTMTVSGPNGYYAKESSSYGAPFMSLSKGGSLADGVYKWELTGASTERVKANPMGLDNGRGDAAREFVNKSMTESGSFRVLNGAIVKPDASMVEGKTPVKRVTFPRYEK